MSNVTAPGIGSGLDVDGIVRSLMAIERQPLDRLDERKNTFEVQLSSYGQIKSALSTFETALKDLSTISKFQVYSSTSTEDSIFTASATSSAVPGDYSVQFDDNGIHQLATPNRMNSTFAVGDATTSIGATGTLTIEVGDPTNNFQVAIDATNNTLNGIRDAINYASDNAGVIATVVTGDAGSQLILTSEDTGTVNQITINDTGNVTSTLAFSETLAQDAKVTIAGLLVTSSSNSVTSAIEGVTINLAALDTAGTSQTLSINRDEEKVNESVQAFVDAYNELRNVTSTERAGVLGGDYTLVSLESRIRDVLNTTPSGITSSFSFLAEIGITTNAGGDLALDTTILNTALQNDFTGVAQLLANENEGYLFRLESTVSGFLDPDGLIDSKEDGLNARIDSVEEQRSRMEFRMELIEARIRRQFSALDALVSNMQATSAFLSSQLASLPQIRRNN